MGDEIGGTIIKDFVNRKYENPLGVHQNDINSGGTGVSGGYRGCYGEAHTDPIFRKDVVKISGIGWKKVFKIRINERKNRVRTRKIWFTGTCCWEIEGKNKGKHSLGRKFSQEPPIPYIAKFRTKKCQP